MSGSGLRVELAPWEGRLALADRLVAEARAVAAASGRLGCPRSRALTRRADRILRPLARFARGWNDDEIGQLLVRLPNGASAVALRGWMASRQSSFAF